MLECFYSPCVHNPTYTPDPAYTIVTLQDKKLRRASSIQMFAGILPLPTYVAKCYRSHVTQKVSHGGGGAVWLAVWTSHITQKWVMSLRKQGKALSGTFRGTFQELSRNLPLGI